MGSRRLVASLSVVVFLGLAVFAAVPERPNILFCIADDASMKSFGAYGSEFVKTPAVDR